jgi:hypothetical protein
MPYIDTTIWIDDEDMTTQDLDDYADDELIAEIKSRGYSVWEKQLEKSPLSDLASLYTTFQTMDRDYFEKELKKFFRETLDVSIY